MRVDLPIHDLKLVKSDIKTSNYTTRNPKLIIIHEEVYLNKNIVRAPHAVLILVCYRGHHYNFFFFFFG